MRFRTPAANKESQVGRSGARLGTRPLGRMAIASMVVLAAVFVLGGCGARDRGSASQSWSGVAFEGDSAFVGTKDGRVVQIRLLDVGGETIAQLGETFVAPEAEGGATEPAFYGTPMVADGRLYVGGYHGVAYSIRAAPRADGGGILEDVREFPIDGNPLAEGIAGSVVPAGDALVIAASEDAEKGRLYVLDAGRLNDGLSAIEVERCRYPATEPIGQLWTTPTVVDGVAYFGDLSHRVYAVSIANCRLVWNAPAELGGAIVAPPVVVGGKLYVGAFDRVFYEIDRATGAVRDLFTAEGWFWAGAATDGRRVYAPSLDGTLHAYDIRDRTVWTYQEGDPQPILSAPVIVGDKIVMASDSGTVTLLSAEGSRLDSRLVKAGDPVRAPLTVRGDVVYVHSLDEIVMALRVDGSRLVPVWDINVSG